MACAKSLLDHSIAYDMHDTKYLNVADTQKSRVTVVSDTHVQHALLTLHKASTWPAKAMADTYIIRTEHTEHLSPRDRGYKRLRSDPKWPLTALPDTPDPTLNHMHRTREDGITVGHSRPPTRPGRSSNSPKPQSERQRRWSRCRQPSDLADQCTVHSLLQSESRDTPANRAM